ncbi:DUF4253 domain-containing protein [Bacteroides ovatus]|nr:DUF4253 domain-containing protein [Bacteroides ovatus]
MENIRVPAIRQLERLSCKPRTDGTISKYWYEEYGAVPGTFTSDQLEYELPAPVPEDRAMEAAIQQYAFCPDMDQSCDGIGSLADTLRQSRIWYFWWD